MKTYQVQTVDGAYFKVLADAVSMDGLTLTFWKGTANRYTHDDEEGTIVAAFSNGRWTSFYIEASSSTEDERNSVYFKDGWYAAIKEAKLQYDHNLINDFFEEQIKE